MPTALSYHTIGAEVENSVVSKLSSTNSWQYLRPYKIRHVILCVETVDYLVLCQPESVSLQVLLGVSRSPQEISRQRGESMSTTQSHENGKHDDPPRGTGIGVMDCGYVGRHRRRMLPRAPSERTHSLLTATGAQLESRHHVQQEMNDMKVMSN